MNRIREILQEKNLTAKDLAEKLGISAPSISVAINGNPTQETLIKIATALNVPVTDLFDQPNSDVFQCPKCGAMLQVAAKELSNQ